jgi:hypothetical protein
VSAPRQDEFGGGIFRSPRAPQGCVYDCVNGLVDDELAIYRRGGVSYRTNVDLGGGVQIVGLADGFLPVVGERTAFWTAVGMHALDPVDDSTPVTVPLSGVNPPEAFAKAWGASGQLVFASSSVGRLLVWGGSLKAPYSVGSITFTNGSRTVVGSGTAWLANVDAGMMMINPTVIVDSVTDNTHLTMRYPWGGVTGSGVAYTLQPTWDVNPAPIAALGSVATAAYVTVVAGRVVVAIGNRAYFSGTTGLGDYGAGTADFASTDYHEIPPPGQIVGVDAVGDSLVLFTTTGVWAATNMNLDLTSATGEPQQTLQQINKDVVAWGNPGVAGFSPYSGVQDWQGQFVVPALDDIYMLGVSSPAISIGRGIRSLYQSYIAAGFRPGLATVYQGHYILPVRSGGAAIDTLVCRLDQRDRTGRIRPAWTRIGGQGRQMLYTGRVRPSGAPSLVGGQGVRLVDATSWFTPDAAHKADADGTVHGLDVIENDVELANRSTTQKVDLLYELQDAASDNPTIVGSWSSGAEGSTWTGLTGSAAENDGRVPKRWRLVKRVRNVRFRWQTVGPAAVARVRGRVLYVRDSNRP